MKMYKKLFAGAIMLFVAGAFLAGCSGTKTSNSNHIIVGTAATYPPFEFTKDNSSELQGFDIELMDALAKEANLTVEWKDMGFDGLIPSLKSGQIQAAIAGINITPEREKMVAFTEPYYETGTVVMHKKGDGIENLADLKGKTIAVQIATAQAAEAKEIPGVKVKEFNNIPDIINEMKIGGSQAALVDGPLAAYYAKKFPNTFEAFKSGTPSQPIAIAVNIDDPELVATLNKALQKIKEDGTYKKISDKWFGSLEIK